MRVARKRKKKSSKTPTLEPIYSAPVRGGNWESEKRTESETENLKNTTRFENLFMALI